MILEDQVCNLEQSKTLHRLGVDQYSQFQHKCNDTQNVVTERKQCEMIEKYVPPVGNTYFAAYNVAELGAMLPDYAISFRAFEPKGLGTAKSKLKKDDDYWVCTILHDDDVPNNYGKTEAQARANLLIKLLLDKVVKIEDVNKRFKKIVNEPK